MEERRKCKRTDLTALLFIKKLDGSGKNAEIPVEILDVSKTGIGFNCRKLLQIGEVYEASLTIWTKEVIDAFLRITRIELKGEEYGYGATFVGMSEMDVARIATYQTINDNEN